MNMTYHQECSFLLISLLVRIAQALKYSQLTGKHFLEQATTSRWERDGFGGPVPTPPIAHAYTIT
jgi:hypothetical protein